MSENGIKKTYRSVFTGKQIDEILASIQFKLDSTQVSNEFSDPGNPVNFKKISSAELANILNKKITDISNPQYLKSIIERIEDSNIYTDADKNKLDSMTTQFRGVYVNKESRDAALLNENLKNNDISMIIDDGNGLQAIQFWDINNSEWVTSQLIRLGDIVPATVVSPGIINFTGIDISKYKTTKFVITVIRGSSIHTKEVLLTYSSSSGGIVYCLHYGDMFSNIELFNVGTSVIGQQMNIMIETLQDSCMVYAQKLCEF